MPSADQRKRLPSADRRQQILDAGARLFVERGFETVSMSEIAAALGTSRPTIYSYFASPENILDALLDERLHALLGRLDPLLKPLRPATSAEAALPGALEAVFRLLLDERDTLALLHSGSGPGFQARRQAFLHELGARLQLDPDLPVRRNSSLLLIVTTLLESLAHRAAGDPAADVDQLARTLALFVRGGTREVIERGEPGRSGPRP